MTTIVRSSRFESLANRILIYLLALTGLGAIMTIRQMTKPSGLADFSVFYLGGQVAGRGAWNDLYPVVSPSAVGHPGLPDASEPKHVYRELAQVAGFRDPYRYVYSPPSAILLIPFGYCRWESSIIVWWVLTGACCCGSGFVSAAMYARVAGRHDWTWAIVILVVAWCPLTWATIRSANTSGVTSLMISLCLYGMTTQRSVLTSFAFYVGAILKFATIPLLVIPIALGRFRILGILAAASILLTAGVIALTGIGPWQEYVTLLSTLGRPNLYPVNFSTLGLINQFIGVDYLEWALAARRVAMATTIVALCVGLRRNRHCDDARVVLAGASASLGWFLLFAPTTQNHYFAYLFPLWGYYVAEARYSWLARFASLVIVGGSIIPIGGSSRDLSPLLQSHMIWSAGAAMVFGLVRLFQRDDRRDQTSPAIRDEKD